MFVRRGHFEAKKYTEKYNLQTPFYFWSMFLDLLQADYSEKITKTNFKDSVSFEAVKRLAFVEQQL